jgi:hypothetical protein
LRTTKVVPCEAINAPIADAGDGGADPTATIAMPTEPGATSFRMSALFVVIKVATFSQRRGGATRLRLPADQDWHGTQRQHTHRLAAEQHASETAAAMGRHND